MFRFLDVTSLLGSSVGMELDLGCRILHFVRQCIYVFLWLKFSDVHSCLFHVLSKYEKMIGSCATWTEALQWWFYFLRRVNWTYRPTFMYWFRSLLCWCAAEMLETVLFTYTNVISCNWPGLMSGLYCSPLFAKCPAEKLMAYNPVSF